jgi:hypothetical protein
MAMGDGVMGSGATGYDDDDDDDDGPTRPNRLEITLYSSILIAIRRSPNL